MDAERKFLKADIAVERSDSNTYEVDIPLDFCFGTGEQPSSISSVD